MAAKKTTSTPKGLAFPRYYTREGISPYEMFEYDYRTSMIKDPSGKIIFQMDNVEVPKHWSQIATDIIAQKYFRKAGVPQPDGSTGDCQRICRKPRGCQQARYPEQRRVDQSAQRHIKHGVPPSYFRQQVLQPSQRAHWSDVLFAFDTRGAQDFLCLRAAWIGIER